MSITIKDIAKKSDVSIATVSRIINKSEKVAPQTPDFSSRVKTRKI